MILLREAVHAAYPQPQHLFATAIDLVAIHFSIGGRFQPIAIEPQPKLRRQCILGGKIDMVGLTGPDIVRCAKTSVRVIVLAVP